MTSLTLRNESANNLGSRRALPTAATKDPLAKSIPTTGGARAAGGWLWNLHCAGHVGTYTYSKQAKTFRLTTDEDTWGTARWATLDMDVDEALAWCFDLDPNLEHVPGQHLDAMARRFRPAAPAAKKPRRTVTQLVQILDSIRAAHLADEALISDEHLAAIADILDR